jgi:hypothetical protein
MMLYAVSTIPRDSQAAPNVQYPWRTLDNSYETYVQYRYVRLSSLIDQSVHVDIANLPFDRKQMVVAVHQTSNLILRSTCFGVTR